nr:hypothetical protein [Tanacetum cinerariifolium]
MVILFFNSILITLLANFISTRYYEVSSAQVVYKNIMHESDIRREDPQFGIDAEEKKVKLAFIINDSARRATFKKRKGVMKEVPKDAGDGASKKMVNWESFIRQRITKANEQLKKQIKENPEKEMTEVMYQCLAERGSIANLTLPDLNRLGGLVDQTLKDIYRRIESLKKVVPAGGVRYMVDNASSLDLMQKTQWFADWINNPSCSHHTIDVGPGYHESNSFANNLNPGLLPALAKLFPCAEHRQLLDARDSPIITALEFVRKYLMKRIVIVQKVIQKCDGPLTPAVAKLFDKIKAASTGYIVEWNGSKLYQVKGSHPEQYVVNLTQKTCSCRKWEISGIPCKHVIAAIHDMTDNGYDVGIPEDWVHDYYKLQTWINVYSHKVNPVNGRDMCSKYDCPTTLLPPKVHPQIGRLPKKRKKSKGEIVMVKGNKLTRQGKTVTCSLCQAAEHNKRSCSSVASQRNESVPKKTTRTKRTSSVTGTSIAAAKVRTQASQASTQASNGSTFKRTKKNASRITPEKVNFITAVGIKSHLNAVEVTAAQVDVNTAQLN